MMKRLISLVLLATVLVGFTHGVAPGPTPPPYVPGFAVGINYSGNENPFPTPTSSTEFAYYAARGFLKSRLPTNWSKVDTNTGCNGTSGFQPVVFGSLDTTSTCYGGTTGYVGSIDTQIAAIAATGGSTLLDVHMFGVGPGGFLVGSSQVPVAAFGDLWGKLSSHYMGMAGIRGYDLMNEWVNGFDSSIAFAASQAAINAIRANGDTTPIYVEGVNYSGAWNWVTGQGNPYNNSNFYQLVDPLNKLVFSAHGYLDNDSSGSNFSWALEIAKPGASPPGIPTSATIGVTRDTPFVAWAAAHNLQIHHGEMGASNDALAAGGADNYAAWNTALSNMIAYAQANNYEVDIFSAGAGFNPNYPPYLGPSSTSNPGVADFTSAGLQSTLLVMLEQYSGYSGAQPIAYRTDLPVTITATANPEAPIVAPVKYTAVGTASPNFTIRYNGKITSPVTITPHDYLSDGVTAAGGTFTPATITLASGNNALANFTYTPSQSAALVIKTTNSAGWIDPPSLGFSSINDVYQANGISTPTNIYGLYRRYGAFIGSALLLQRTTDNAQLAFSFNNVGNLPRAAIQTWASSNIIPVVAVYDQSPLGNTLTFTGTLCNLQLNNAAGYPEIECPSGINGNFSTPVNGQTAVSVIANMNQSVSSGGGLFRQDQFLGPLIFGINYFQIYNTGFVGGTVVNASAVSVGQISTGLITGAYHEYAATYASGATNGIKTYLDGSLNAQATGALTRDASFTCTQSGTNVTVSSVLGGIVIGDTLAGTGVAANTTMVSQTSGTPGGAGVYVTSLSGTASSAACVTTGIQNTLNAAFGSQSTQFGYARFGASPWVGNLYNLEFEQGQTLTLSQIAAVAAFDAAYYSTPLPDTLPPVAPTIVGGGIPNNTIFSGLGGVPFLGVSIVDTNSGTPTDTIIITLSGAAATLTGSGITGSNPYNIASATPASVTSTLHGLTLNTSASAGSSISIVISATSSAGPTASTTMPVTVQAYVAETPFAAPIGTFTPTNMFGVNLSGGENNGFSPTYLGLPTATEINYFAGKNFGLTRMPITSRSFYTTAFGLMNASYVAAMKTSIDAAFAANMWVNIDVHDFGGVFYSVNNSFPTILPGTIAQLLFNDEITRLMTKFKNYPNVIFGLQNEPVGMTVAQWFTSCTQAITAARNASGSTQLITIPGGATFTGAHDWVSSGNGAAWAGYNGDPANNFMFEMHQYLDSNNSGGSPVAVVGYGSTALVAATGWLATNGFTGFLGEFGVAWDPWFPINTGANINNYDPAHGITLTTNSITENGNMLAYMKTNRAQWASWAEWAGGINFAAPPQSGGYTFNPEPARPYPTPIIDQPQIVVLQGGL